MRKLTFKGFMRSYVRDLSAAGTNSLFKLVAEAESGNARLVEPTVLYAICHGKSDLYIKIAVNDEIGCAVCGSYDAETLVIALEAGDLPLQYQKIWDSYKSLRDMPETVDAHKELMRCEIRRLQSEKNISNYRIYTSLKLNPGNINSWLTGGDNRKISLESEREVLKFVESYGD